MNVFYLNPGIDHAHQEDVKEGINLSHLVEKEGINLSHLVEKEGINLSHLVESDQGTMVVVKGGALSRLHHNKKLRVSMFVHKFW